MTMDDLLELTEKLTAILKDPQPGLSIWQRWRAETGRELRDALTQKLDAPSSEPDDEAVGTIEIRGPSDPTKLGEVLYELLRETAARQAPVPSELEALRELVVDLHGLEASWDGEQCGNLSAASATLRAILAKLPGETVDPPARRPARDVAHDILALGSDGRAMSTFEVADAIVAIIRADRKGGQ